MDFKSANIYPFVAFVVVRKIGKIMFKLKFTKVTKATLISVNLHSLYVMVEHVYYSKLFVYISYSTNSVDIMSPSSILWYCVIIQCKPIV